MCIRLWQKECTAYPDVKRGTPPEIDIDMILIKNIVFFQAGDTFSTASFLGIHSSNFRAVDFLSLRDVSASKRDVRLMNPYEMMSDW